MESLHYKDESHPFQSVRKAWLLSARLERDFDIDLKFAFSKIPKTPAIWNVGVLRNHAGFINRKSWFS